MKTLIIESVLYVTIFIVAFMLIMTLYKVLKERIKKNNFQGIAAFYIINKQKRYVFHIAMLGLNIATLAYWMHIEAASVLWMLILIVTVPVSSLLLTWAARITALVLYAVVKFFHIAYQWTVMIIKNYLDIFKIGWF